MGPVDRPDRSFEYLYIQGYKVFIHIIRFNSYNGVICKASIGVACVHSPHDQKYHTEIFHTGRYFIVVFLLFAL